ncbi:MAG: hypothetical protein IPK85_00170 [Gemmatimonadetes bacterium]|nr:hypothetical protein [Gemmatimonadota bacterium]
MIESFEAGVSVNAEDRPAGRDEHGVLKVSAISAGQFLPEENKAILASELPRMGPSVRAGDVLVSRANTLDLVGLAARAPATFPHLHLPDKIWRARLIVDDDATARWLVHVVNAPHTRAAIRRRATGTSGSMKNIGQHAFVGIAVPTPPAEARGRMADVLDSLARQADVTSRLAKARRAWRRDLLSSVLPSASGHRSFAASPFQLRDLLHESRLVASSGATARKLTVRLYGRGVLAKAGSRSGSQSTQYYRRRAGQLIYSKLDFLNGAFGIVPPELDGYESTLDLPAFDVSPEINPRWLLHFLSWPGFYRKQVRLANGGRKARRVNPSDLLRVEIHVPPRHVQDNIAACLDAVDCEIDILTRLAERIEKFRRAVIDKLLSGELAIPDP